MDDIETYVKAVEAAGFEIIETRSRGEFAVEFFAAARARMAEAGGPPPLGLHIIIGADTPTKLANMGGAFSSGLLAPVELISQKAS